MHRHPQAKVAHARALAAERAEHIKQLESELASANAALAAATQQLRDRDRDAKAMVNGLEAALEATRATLEAERGRSLQKLKVRG